jgi:pimeloyl-ACP methyl ester carboxylesterase
MARATAGDVKLYYDTAGEGPTVAFVGDVGAGAWLWGWQQPAVAGPYETVVWDMRGTGRSDAPPGPYDVPTLAADLEAVLGAHGVRTAHLVGVGLGGMVALEHAHRFDRASSLALVGTAPDGEAVSDDLRQLRADPTERAELRRRLSVAFEGDIRAQPDLHDQITAWRAADDASLAGWDAQAAAMRSFSRPPLYEVTKPTVVFHGTGDQIVPTAVGEHLARDLPRSEFRAVDGGHWCFIEQSGAVSDALVAWLGDVTDAD